MTKKNDRAPTGPHPERLYREAVDNIRHVLEQISAKRVELRFWDSKWTVTDRIKSEASIQCKLAAWRTTDHRVTRNDIHDIAGVRVIVESAHCVGLLSDYLVYDINRGGYLSTRARFRDKLDYLQNPREDGYRGIHLILEVLTTDNVFVPLELQIRSILQHKWAEMSHVDFYKTFEDVPAGLRQGMRNLSRLIDSVEHEADSLRRARCLDRALDQINGVLRADHVERLRRKPSQATGKGLSAFLEFQRQLRRCLLSAGWHERAACAALLSIAHEEAKAGNPGHDVLLEVCWSVIRIVAAFPQAIRMLGLPEVQALEQPEFVGRAADQSTQATGGSRSGTRKPTPRSREQDHPS